MADLSEWGHKDVWRRRGMNFMVEISRHSESTSSIDPYQGPHRWCVYAYVYPKHPRFGMFEGPNMWQDATSNLNLHCGCSFLEYPMYEGKVTSVKVGADYNHLHDEKFTHYASKERAYEVFEDAGVLFDILQRQAEAAAS